MYSKKELFYSEVQRAVICRHNYRKKKSTLDKCIKFGYSDEEAIKYIQETFKSYADETEFLKEWCKEIRQRRKEGRINNYEKESINGILIHIEDDEER